MNENERIKLIRNLMNMKQKDLADLLGITQAAIGKLESNKMNLTSENLKKICLYFDVSADFILFGKNESETIANLLKKKAGK